MRLRKLTTIAALLAMFTWNVPQFALAHGGGGGGGFGGGGHGGGFGGGHMGGFGGGHMGGFGGGHMGGFGGGGFGGHSGFGGYGGYGGGHYGGLGGGHYGGLGGGHYGGLNSGLGGHYGGISGGSLHSGGIGHSGGLGGASSLSGIGGHHAGALGTVHHNPNSFTNHHFSSGHNLTGGAAGNRVMSGYRGVNSGTFAGTHAQGLLSHQASGLGHHSNFLQHHPVSTGGAGRGLTGLGNAGGRGTSLGHHGGMGMNGYNNMHHHHGFGNGFGNRGFFGFPFFGFGFPFFGFGFGYPFYGLGYGYGLYGYGYGGYGYGGYGYGYNPYAYYYPYGYGYGYGYPYGYGMYGNYPAAGHVAQPTTKASDAEVFAQKGENDFKAGDYKGAVYAWRHALVDDPQNGVLMMMLAQGLFATGSYDEAAGAVQQAMQLLPENQWGVVVSNYKELYGKIGDYTSQLRALEKAVKAAPDDPGLRFLLGFHYGYLGYPKDAVKQLDKVLQEAPADQLAKKLHEIFTGKLPKDGGPAAPDKEAGKRQPGGKQAGNQLPVQNKIVADGNAAGG